MTATIVMELTSVTVIIVMKLHSMTVVIVMTNWPRDAHIYRRHDNSYVMSVCVDYVYEGLRNECVRMGCGDVAYKWTELILRTFCLLQFCAQVEDYDGNHRHHTRVYDGHNRHGRQFHDGNNRHGSCWAAAR